MCWKAYSIHGALRRENRLWAQVWNCDGWSLNWILFEKQEVGRQRKKCPFIKLVSSRFPKELVRKYKLSSSQYQELFPCKKLGETEEQLLTSGSWLAAISNALVLLGELSWHSQLGIGALLLNKQYNRKSTSGKATLWLWQIKTKTRPPHNHVRPQF